MGRESEQPTEELSASAAKRETRLRLEERVGAKSDAVSAIHETPSGSRTASSIATVPFRDMSQPFRIGFLSDSVELFLPGDLRVTEGFE